MKYRNIALMGLVLANLASISIYTPAHAYNVSAWLPSWDTQEAEESFRNNADIIDTISPFWYNVNEDGTISAKEKPHGGIAEDDDIIEFAHQNGITIIPTITNSFDGEKVTGIFNEPQKKRENIQNIVDLVRTKNYDGIDIDYEGLKSEDKDAFTAYIKDLSAQMKKYDKKLTIAIQPNSFAGLVIYGDRGQDWAGLHPYVDEFRIMTYDYGWRGSIPRPVAPYYWVEEVVLYALANVPSEKIYLGVPFYGYGWSDDFFSSYTYDTIKLILSKYGVDFQYDPWQKTNRLFYVSEFDARDTKVPHEVWFENHVSLEPKLELVKKFNLGGIAIWRLGKEDKENWRRIKRELKGAQIDLPLYFSDVSRDTKYFNEITRLADLGIVTGQGGTHEFNPTHNVNRAEILKMSLNAFARDTSTYAFPELRPEDYENPFSDADDEAWYFPYVQTAVEIGIIKGYPDGTFKPGKNIIRAEALKIAIESAGISVDEYSKENDEWYKKYENWALEKEIYKGKFVPDAEITRGEAAYIIAKVIETVEK
jgi:spore germination protein YaaH